MWCAHAFSPKRFSSYHIFRAIAETLGLKYACWLIRCLITGAR